MEEVSCWGISVGLDKVKAAVARSLALQAAAILDTEDACRYIISQVEITSVCNESDEWTQVQLLAASVGFSQDGDVRPTTTVVLGHYDETHGTLVDTATFEFSLDFKSLSQIPS